VAGAGRGAQLLCLVDMAAGSTGGGRRSARHGGVEVCSELSEDSSEWSIKEAMEEGDVEDHQAKIEDGHRSRSWSGRRS
jgi:hypothetical protein